jgi:hypothetical protein
LWLLLSLHHAHSFGLRNRNVVDTDSGLAHLFVKERLGLGLGLFCGSCADRKFFGSAELREKSVTHVGVVLHFVAVLGSDGFYCGHKFLLLKVSNHSRVNSLDLISDEFIFYLAFKFTLKRNGDRHSVKFL